MKPLKPKKKNTKNKKKYSADKKMLLETETYKCKTIC